MIRLRRWALASTAATYLLIFVGGLVRVSGAGMGCPDWPKCFGRWIPPFDASQLPPHIDPAQFNLTLAWIEYCNRLIGVTIGLLIAVTAILAFVYARRHARVLYPILAALVLVAIEGWQGSVVVGSGLAPFVVTVHMLLAFLIVSLLLYATLQLYHMTAPAAPARAAATGGLSRVWLAALWILTIVTVGLGTQIRSALQVLSEQFPLSTEMELLSQIGPMGHIHRTVGVIVVLVAWHVGMKLWIHRSDHSPLVVQSAGLLMLVTLVQGLLGVVLVWVALTPLLQLFHLWLSSILIGALLTLNFALSHEETHDVGIAA